MDGVAGTIPVLARSWDHPTHPYKNASSLRPCLGQGASRRARVGRVRSLNFLSVLHDLLPLRQMG